MPPQTTPPQTTPPRTTPPRTTPPQTTPLRVSKIGVGAYVFRFAHTNSAAYGVFAIVIAVLAGWLAAAIFRKV